jgi:hypothetical protein
MSRRLSAFALVAGLVPVLAGCCSSSQCGQRPGLFSRSQTSSPCQTVGRGSGCFDGATGQPIACPPGVPANVVPGGGPYPYPPIGTIPGPIGPRPEDLPMPSPSDMIRPPAVPIPAPGDASLPFPSSPGVPVKNK